jgi:hypothetical protein
MYVIMFLLAKEVSFQNTYILDRSLKLILNRQKSTPLYFLIIIITCSQYEHSKLLGTLLRTRKGTSCYIMRTTHQLRERERKSESEREREREREREFCTELKRGGCHLVNESA